MTRPTLRAFKCRQGVHRAAGNICRDCRRPYTAIIDQRISLGVRPAITREFVAVLADDFTRQFVQRT